MTAFDAALALSAREWRGQFGHATLERGRNYWRDGRVVKLGQRWSGNVLQIAGTVQGTTRKPYQVVILIEGDPGDFFYDTDCTCPVGFNCKHAVAILMAAADAQQAATAARPTKRKAPPRDQRWEDWLAAFETPAIVSAHASEPMPAEPDGRRLAFLLDATLGTIPGLKARAVWLHLTRQGRLGKPVPVGRSALGGGPDWSGLDARQLDLLAHLRLGATAHAQGFEWHRLGGTHGEAVLQRLLADDLCFWQKPTGKRILATPPQAIDWHWQRDTDGTQALAPRLAADARLLQVHGLWCFDPATGGLGPLDGDPELAQRLLQTPPLPPEQAEAMRKRWQKQPQLQALPLPEAFARTRRLRGPPIPVLRLYALPLSLVHRRGDAGSLPCARMSFDYEGQRIDCTTLDDPVSRTDGDTLLLIERDHAVELNAIDTLFDNALQPALHRYDVGWLLQDVADAADFACARTGPDEADTLLQHAQALQAQGFLLEFDSSFPIELTAAPAHWKLDTTGSDAGNAWFDLELGIEVDGADVPLLPILRQALLDRNLQLKPAPGEPADAVWYAPLDARRRVPLPLAQVRALLAPLLQWLDHDDGRGGDTLRIPRVAAGVIDELESASATALRTRTSEGLARLAGLLRDASRRRRVALPTGLHAQLRDYQHDGLDWLDFLAEADLGGVLADDMGLGKTLQVLAHLLAEKQQGRLPHPALIVAPTSVLSNWRDQAARFTPGLRARVLHGPDRRTHFATLADFDLVITSYPLLARDREPLLQQPFSLAVFDEAQAIKNPRAKTSLVARELQVPRRLAVTGTPLENHLGELWSQFDCVLPGLLGDSRQFTRTLRTPIEKHGDGERQAQLNRRIAPFLLRRNKEQVASELPPRTEIVHTVELAGGQRSLYETLRLAMHDKVQQAIATRGLARSGIVILDALLKLRQACCDPRLVKLDAARRVRESAKLQALLPMLEELLDEGRRILLFSQFTGMLDLIQAELQQRGIDFLRLDGRTRNRDIPVQRFQSADCPLFLISLKAGGVGLNLTAADTVIHYDPWWNPAVERQATDRAHRIGQDKPVFVYKLICAGTVEEKIQSMQQRKAALAQAVLEGGSRQSLAFKAEDVEALFAPL